MISNIKFDDLKKTFRKFDFILSRLSTISISDLSTQS